MLQVNVTELRNQLPSYLKKVQNGEELLVFSRGKVIARIVPATDHRQAAQAALAELRGQCRVGDVVSPIDVDWTVNR